MIQDTGYVLKIRDYGEKDKIITFFTYNHGKITAFAKSAAKSLKRFGSKLEIGVKLNITLLSIKENRLKNLQKIEIAEQFPSFRSDLNQFTLLSIFLELIDKISAEDDQNKTAFMLLDSAISFIPRCKKNDNLLFSFQLKLITLSGFGLNLTNCNICNSTMENEFNFILDSNSFVCAKCMQNVSGKCIQLNEGIKKTILILLNLNLNQCERVIINSNYSKIIATILQNNIREIIGSDLMSFDFFKFIP